MTNGEKYTTAKERILAHKAWCDDEEDCRRLNVPCAQCALEWLYLEFDGDKTNPLPCPFCGGQITFIMLDEDGAGRMECLSCDYRSRKSINQELAILEHNRVARTVAPRLDAIRSHQTRSTLPKAGGTE